MKDGGEGDCRRARVKKREGGCSRRGEVPYIEEVVAVASFREESASVDV